MTLTARLNAAPVLALRPFFLAAGLAAILSGAVCLAILRRLASLVAPAGYQTWLTTGGLCWILAFGLFLWVHAPMLWSPRPDGRPG